MKGIAFITYKSKAGVDKALEFDGTEYAGRTLKVNCAKGNGKGDKGKGKSKGEKGKGKGGDRNDELTVFVRGLSFDLDEATIRKDFEECGEVERLSLPKNEEGKMKGIAFIQYKNAEGVTKALEFDGKDYAGRTLGVSKAGEGGKGKGKDGKGKGKDGKGKGKDGKGKGKAKGKAKMSTEKKAAKDGAMVESTGTKQTFADSDDEEEAPPKKKVKKAPVEEEEDDE